MSDTNVYPLPAVVEQEQAVFFGMPVESSTFTLEGAKGTYGGEFFFEQNVRGTWVGRVAGIELKNGRRTWKIEVLEAEVTG